MLNFQKISQPTFSHYSTVLSSHQNEKLQDYNEFNQFKQYILKTEGIMLEPNLRRSQTVAQIQQNNINSNDNNKSSVNNSIFITKRLYVNTAEQQQRIDEQRQYAKKLSVSPKHRLEPNKHNNRLVQSSTQINFNKPKTIRINMSQTQQNFNQISVKEIELDQNQPKQQKFLHFSNKLIKYPLQYLRKLSRSNSGSFIDPNLDPSYKQQLYATYSGYNVKLIENMNKKNEQNNKDQMSQMSQTGTNNQSVSRTRCPSGTSTGNHFNNTKSTFSMLKHNTIIQLQNQTQKQNHTLKDQNQKNKDECLQNQKLQKQKQQKIQQSTMSDFKTENEIKKEQCQMREELFNVTNKEVIAENNFKAQLESAHNNGLYRAISIRNTMTNFNQVKAPHLNKSRMVMKKLQAIALKDCKILDTLDLFEFDKKIKKQQPGGGIAVTSNNNINNNNSTSKFSQEENDQSKKTIGYSYIKTNYDNLKKAEKAHKEAKLGGKIRLQNNYLMPRDRFGEFLTYLQRNTGVSEQTIFEKQYLKNESIQNNLAKKTAANAKQNQNNCKSPNAGTASPRGGINLHLNNNTNNSTNKVNSNQLSPVSQQQQVQQQGQQQLHLKQIAQGTEQNLRQDRILKKTLTMMMKPETILTAEEQAIKDCELEQTQKSLYVITDKFLLVIKKLNNLNSSARKTSKQIQEMMGEHYKWLRKVLWPSKDVKYINFKTLTSAMLVDRLLGRKEKRGLFVQIPISWQKEQEEPNEEGLKDIQDLTIEIENVIIARKVGFLKVFENDALQKIAESAKQRKDYFLAMSQKSGQTLKKYFNEVDNMTRMLQHIEGQQLLIGRHCMTYSIDFLLNYFNDRYGLSNQKHFDKDEIKLYHKIQDIIVELRSAVASASKNR